jgi:hypothetical protein
MRLAVNATLVSFILKDHVAIVERKPIWITTGCWLRVRRVGWKSEFLVRGGIRLFPVDKLVRIEDKTYHIIAERKLKYGTVMVADKMMSGIGVEFKHPLVIKQGYLVFEIAEKDAKLVDDEPTHVLAVFEHTAYFRKAEIKIAFKEKEGNIVFNDWTSCRQKSIALTVAFIPVGSEFTVCYNSNANKYRCYDMIATIPPVSRKEFFV